MTQMRKETIQAIIYGDIDKINMYIQNTDHAIAIFIAEAMKPPSASVIAQIKSLMDNYENKLPVYTFIQFIDDSIGKEHPIKKVYNRILLQSGKSGFYIDADIAKQIIKSEVLRDLNEVDDIIIQAYRHTANYFMIPDILDLIIKFNSK